MFFDQKLKRIQEAKDRMALRSELRRSLIGIEVQGIGRDAHQTLSCLTLGLTVAQQILGLLRKR